MIIFKIITTCIIIGLSSLISMCMFSPGDIPKQLAIVAFWFLAGFSVCRIWSDTPVNNRRAK